jgi:hypothetical protein
MLMCEREVRIRSSIAARGALGAVLALAGAVDVGAQPRWRLVEDQRIGGADTGAASFNQIRDLAAGARGQIYVLDVQVQEIRLFDASGRFVRLVGRAGSGPGEYREPNGIRVAPDGSLWVNDHRNARFTVFTADGAYAKQVTVPPWGYGWRWDGVIDTQGRVLETIPFARPEPRRVTRESGATTSRRRSSTRSRFLRA